MDSAKKRGGIICKHHLLLMAEEMKVLKKLIVLCLYKPFVKHTTLALQQSILKRKEKNDKVLI